MKVFDLEADGLLDTITKIHCVSYTSDGKTFKTIFDPVEMRDFFLTETLLIGHNIVRYDIRAVLKVLGVQYTGKLYDTLAMSWVFEPNRLRHGLDPWGETVGISKPKIDDWENLTPAEYQHRCEEDVKINWLVWERLIKKAKLIYDDRKELDRFLQYLTFKMETAAKAEDAKWKVDLDLVQRCIDELTLAQGQKVEELREYMPMKKNFRTKTFPAKPFKKDGSLSAQGLQWKELLQEHGLPSNYKGDIEVFKDVEPANPKSSDQVKEWLFSLGWEPCTFDYKKNDDGSERTVPQVRKDGELTPSVQLLIDDHPGVAILDGLTVIQHRLSIFKGFMECQVDGYLTAEIDGFTNTLRFKHKKPLVNLPGVDKPWGKEVRGALIAPEGYVLCGADMVSLESTTKRHYLYPYDPEYVREMSTEGFDEHLDLAVKAKYLSLDDYNFFIRSDEDTVNDTGRFKSIKKIRKLFKPVNYSAIYGVGKAKLSRTAGMPIKEAGVLLKTYWERNWGILEFSKDVLKTVKTVDGMMWIKNPVSGFWYSLRYEKDAFSTINQGTGVYCFDNWLAFYLSRRPNIVGQFHDESINCIKDGEQQEHTECLKWAIGKVNDKLKLNIDLDIEVKFGLTYADVH
jgi:hypothetical protein